MSFALDVNILLYASDGSSPFSRRAQRLLEACAAGPEVFCLSWPTLSGYLRIATHPAIFDHPLSPDDALANIERLLALPLARVLLEEDGFWEIYRELVGTTRARGNLIPDAHLAALLRLHGVRTLYTNDRDFRKFDFLEVRSPFDS